MKLKAYARMLLESEDLENKLLSPKGILEENPFSQNTPYDLPSLPGRGTSFSFSEKKAKFPGKGSLAHGDNRAKAFHFFANHELLAIEMMAAALLIYPEETEEEQFIKLRILDTLQDEQKHFKLYRHYMNERGVKFGDFPLNDFFWRQMKDLKTPTQFFAMMSLTFESANLDFAKYYSELFEQFEDLEGSRILETVYQDEISHVALGAQFLKKWRQDKSLWQYYQDHLVFPLTPARAKGMNFDFTGRKRAGLPEDFIHSLEAYQDDYQITQRRQWIKNS